MKSVSLTFPGFLLALSVHFAAPAFAACSGDQMTRLLDMGFSKAQIMQLCGSAEKPADSPDAPGKVREPEGFTTDAPPPAAERGEDYLPGVWRVSQQGAYGSSLEMWEMNIQGNHLSVTAFSPHAIPGIPLPLDHRKQVIVQQARFADGRFQITFRSMQSVVVRYDLRVINAERMEGNFSSEDTGLSDLGILQGKSGVLKMQGKVVMLKQ
jgi:hypothetical protein